MTNRWKLPRKPAGTGSTAPVGLLAGELAYVEDSGTLYIGLTSGSIIQLASRASSAGAVVAGADTQGSVNLTVDWNEVGTTAANPSGVTLPAATAGRAVRVRNNGTVELNVYPTSGQNIDDRAVNAFLTLQPEQFIEFYCYVAGTWRTPLDQQLTGLLESLKNAGVDEHTVLVGFGVDTAGAIVMDANTVLGRASENSVQPYACSDYMLTDFFGAADQSAARTSLGLGTIATESAANFVGQSELRATGINTTSSSQAVLADLDTLSTPSGIYWCPGSGQTGTNPIAPNTNGTMYHRSASTSASQIFIGNASGRMFWRKASSSTWSAWLEVQAGSANLDLLAAVTLAPNTFPARSGAGAVAAKPITDLGLGLMADATEAAMRSTLGLVTLGIGSTGASAIADLDDVTVLSGIYACTSAGTTAGTLPLGTLGGAGSNGTVIHRVAGIQGMQIFIARTSNRMFWRNLNTGAWGAWLEILSTSPTGIVTFSNGFAQGGMQYDTLYDSGNTASGGTVTVGAFRRWTRTGTATIAALTVKLPASPVDGQLFTFSARGTITALTYQNSAAVAIAGSPTTIAAGDSHTFYYNSTAGVWYPG